MATRPWLPTDIGSALIEWWDAQQGVTTSGSSVTQWKGVVLGTSAVQSGSTATPNYSATARNGKPGLIYTGSQLLTFVPTGFPSGSPVTLASAHKNDGNGTVAINTSNIYTLFFGPSSLNNGNGIGLGESVSGNNVSFGTPGNGINTGISPALLDRFIIGDATSSASDASNIYYDGANNSTGTITYTITPQLGLIGGRYGPTWGGTIQQLLVFNRVLTTSERQQLEGWESWYDGKAGSNLPANHPYKAAAPTVTTGGTILTRRRPLILMAS